MSRTLSSLRYAILISYSEIDQGWLADVPDLAHCTAFGHSPREALDELERALAAWMQAAKNESKPIPEPRARFDIDQR
ncbi:MAG: type II toxin-antitoxin system HicB family antitoxin [Candidatus Melainabacteria bacterium HGW-Melainabacteria-1]|nr:MAG: type II toxin-antitoxin system HicB family antitoxin [Candidatus Melainabacteria bacterium HGW-Melainabacteria-1]